MGLKLASQTPMISPELRATLDNAYAVFARYPMPDYLGLSGAFQLRDLSLERWKELDEKYDIDLLMLHFDNLTRNLEGRH